MPGVDRAAKRMSFGQNGGITWVNDRTRKPQSLNENLNLPNSIIERSSITTVVVKRSEFPVPPSRSHPACDACRFIQLELLMIAFGCLRGTPGERSRQIRLKRYPLCCAA